MDICDYGHLFGIRGLQLATISQPVSRAVLALSESSAKLLHPRSPRVSLSQESEGPATPETHMDLTSIAFLCALEEIRSCVTNMSHTWDSQRQGDVELLEALSPHAVHRDLNSAIYWLMVRLGKFRGHMVYSVIQIG